VASVVIVKDTPSNLFLSDKILRLKVADAEKPWLLWFLRSPQGRAAIEARATGNQLSMRNLSQRNLLEIETPWPNKNERAEIVCRIESAFDWLDRIAIGYSAAAQQLPKLDGAILAKAFRGELVPQDPNDEPASAMLERVNAEPKDQLRGSRGRTPGAEPIKEKLMALGKNLEQVLIDADDWVPAQTAFQRCGIGDGAPTDDIERLYHQLRDLDTSGKLEAQAVTDSQGRKIYDRIRLKAV
jgi:type I restriction enzyme S subunit